MAKLTREKKAQHKEKQGKARNSGKKKKGQLGRKDILNPAFWGIDT